MRAKFLSFSCSTSFRSSASRGSSRASSLSEPPPSSGDPERDNAPPRSSRPSPSISGSGSTVRKRPAASCNSITVPPATASASASASTSVSISLWTTWTSIGSLPLSLSWPSIICLRSSSAAVVGSPKALATRLRTAPVSRREFSVVVTRPARLVPFAFLASSAIPS